MHLPTFPAALLATLVTLSALPAVAGTLVQRVSVNDNSTGLSLTITPPVSISGEQLYLAALLEGQCGNPGRWYAFDGRVWKLWSGVDDELPAVSLTSPSELVLLQSIDLHAYPRVHFYAGLGSSATDMIQRGNYEVFYRYFGLAAPCAPGTQPAFSR